MSLDPAKKKPWKPKDIPKAKFKKNNAFKMQV
jgi:hypothetical protein